MIDIINCIENYIKITNDAVFIEHSKILSERLIEGIRKGYSSNEKEPSIVKTVERIINSVGSINSIGSSVGSNNQKFSIFSESIFIHGIKSQVEFKYYGKKTKRELGDIIFILSVVYNNKKYFEKMTINQVKKSQNASWSFSSRSAEEQLYLLSRFPEFEGVEGSLIPLEKYNLFNNSGCLGTHGLLYGPGDFALISSKVLEILLSSKKTIGLYDFPRLDIKCMRLMDCPCLRLSYDIKEHIDIFHEIIHYYLRSYKYKYLPFVCNLPILGNDCIAYNIYDFSEKYLQGRIGELIYADKLIYNESACKLLDDILKNVKRKPNIKNNINSSYSYSCGNSKNGGDDGVNENFDYDNGGGIGIIHTTVNLREKIEE
ncbi:MAG: hypothetical protein Fur0023_20080 [Bacteroidia bacterium]